MSSNAGWSSILTPEGVNVTTQPTGEPRPPANDSLAANEPLYWVTNLITGCIPIIGFIAWIVLPLTWGRWLMRHHPNNQGRQFRTMFNRYMIPFWASIAMLAISVLVIASGVGLGFYAKHTAPQAGVSSPRQGSNATPAHSAAPAPSSTTPCHYWPDSSGSVKEVERPSRMAPNTGTSNLTLNTNLGPIVIELDQEKAPCTSHSLRHLASQGFYNGTTCHRLADAENFHILQCGDTSKDHDGTGTPGYKYATENLPTDNHNQGKVYYPKGVVVMAAAQKPESGSQFFICFGDSDFDPRFTVVGEVTQGLDLIQQVASHGVKKEEVYGGGQPNQPLTFNTVTAD